MHTDLPSGSPPTRRSLLYSAGPLLLFVLALAVSHPWVEARLWDDFSYIRSAQTLAQTGHIVYNGWATAMLGWQLYVGAAAIRLFGVSYTAPRLATMLFACLTLLVTQRTFVRLGIGERAAAAGTLMLTLSPLYLQLSCTFFSDIYGVFVTMTCLYACIRAVEASDDRHAALWVVGAALSNAVLGSCRQTAWLGVLVMVPSTLWLLRRRRLPLWTGLAAVVLGAGLVYATMHWYAQQPYIITDSSLYSPGVLKALLPRIVKHQMQWMAMCLFLLLPLLIGTLPGALRRRPWLWLAGVALLAVQAYLIAHAHGVEAESGSRFAAPFQQDWYTVYGYFNSANGYFKGPPVVLTTPIRAVVNAVFDLSLITAALAFFRRRRDLSAGWPPQSAPTPDGALPIAALAVLVAPFCIVYQLLLIPRCADQMSDRYSLPIAFVLLALLLRWWRQHCGRLPAVVLAATALVALYSVGCLHDLFSSYRARMTLVHTIESAGYSDRQVEAGWDLSADTELRYSPYLNDKRIKPRTLFHPLLTPTGPCLWIFHHETYPHMDPVYAVRFDAHEGLGNSGFAPVYYTRWLAFGQRSPLYAVRCAAQASQPR